MRLVAYSGYDEKNSAIDEHLASMLPARRRAKMTYIPSAFNVPNHEFKYVQSVYKDYGIVDISVFHADLPFDKLQLKSILKSDLVYLSGGNTFYFLKSLRRAGLLEVLIKYVTDGGILAGLSAGAIILTPSILTASFPDFDRDDNLVKLPKKDWKALNLLNFEIFPHFSREPEYHRELLRASKLTSTPILGLPDGSGIIVDGQITTYFGSVWCYTQGRSIKLT